MRCRVRVSIVPKNDVCRRRFQTFHFGNLHLLASDPRRCDMIATTILWERAFASYAYRA